MVRSIFLHSFGMCEYVSARARGIVSCVNGALSGWPASLRTYRKCMHYGYMHVGDPRGGIAAVLVEGKRFCYVYGSAAQPGVKHGQQEVVDMQLQAGETVLGARLVQQQPGLGWALAGAVSSRDSSGSMALLVLLTQHRLLTLKLRV